MTLHPEGRLQVISESGEYKLVTTWKGMTQNVLGEPPPGIKFQAWEESKYRNLSLAASWFANLPDVGFFVFEGKDCPFGPDSNSRFDYIDDYGPVVRRAYEWLQKILRDRGWEV